MNSDNILQSIQKGFRVSLGATTSLLEILQDAQKRDQNLSKLQSDFNQLSTGWQDPQTREANLAKIRADLDQLTSELADKGEVTERDARSFVDHLVSQYGGGNSASNMTVNTTATPVVPSASQIEIEELTAQLAEMRSELEKLRAKGNN
jgi:polyhydroxyalkanoate synthesis regulator phasin